MLKYIEAPIEPSVNATLKGWDEYAFLMLFPFVDVMYSTVKVAFNYVLYTKIHFYTQKPWLPGQAGPERHYREKPGPLSRSSREEKVHRAICHTDIKT